MFSVRGMGECRLFMFDPVAAFDVYRQPIEPIKTSGPEYVNDVVTLNVQRYAGFCKTIAEYISLSPGNWISDVN